MRILVPGGAGFIGSNFVRKCISLDWDVVVFDSLTYSGSLVNLQDFLPQCTFVKGDIRNLDDLAQLSGEFDALVNFAGETHVDRAIENAASFVETDVLGVYNLLTFMRDNRVKKFIQISTDEVYGSTGLYAVREDHKLDPTNPYAASKAGAELLVNSYYKTYGANVCSTRGANTVGPYQYPEKVVPLFITNALLDIPLPIYGIGRNLRDYIYVDDHVDGILAVLEKGRPGEVYNIGGGNTESVNSLAHIILSLLGKDESLVTFVPDRLGHDTCYRMSCALVFETLGWHRQYDFRTALEKTVHWYVDNKAWWMPIRESSDFVSYLSRRYNTGN